MGELLSYGDPATGARRDAWIAGDRLERVLFVATGGALPPRDWLVELFEQDVPLPRARPCCSAARPVP